MKLQSATLEHVREIMGWFPDRESAVRWGSPSLRFPLREERFLEDIHWGRMVSLVSLSDQGRVLAFGQYYPKLGRCHLARLAVAPDLRAQGLGIRFIRSLMKAGGEDLATREFSLFVLTTNEPAVACYRKLDFTQADTPEGTPFIENCIFMVRKNSVACY